MPVMDSHVIIAGISCAALICVCIVCWRSLTSVERISGTSRRADDRDRRDMHALLTMLVEKVVPYHPDLVRTHSQERIIKAKLDAAVEGAAIQEAASPRPEPPIESQYTTEELAARM